MAEGNGNGNGATNKVLASLALAAAIYALFEPMRASQVRTEAVVNKADEERKQQDRENNDRERQHVDEIARLDERLKAIERKAAP